MGASGSFLADSAGSGCGGRLSDAAGVGHVQGFGHHQGPSLVNQLESFSETIKVIFNDIKS